MYFPTFQVFEDALNYFSTDFGCLIAPNKNEDRVVLYESQYNSMKKLFLPKYEISICYIK